MARHRAFGLRIAADVPIPGLLPDTEGGPVDVEIDLAGADRSLPDGILAHLRFDHPPDDHGCTLRLWSDPRGRAFRFLFGDGTEFLVEDGRRIRGRWSNDVGLEGACVYLLGPVLGFVLGLRGVTCLHASAVADDHGAVAVLGTGGHGKSTTAAALGRRGVPVLTDDLLAVRSDGTRPMVQPAYPRIRLWPHAVRGLFGSEEALPRITPDDPDWDKRFVDLTEEPFRFCPEAVPLSVLYVGVQDETALSPRVEPMSGGEALLAGLTNAYSRRLRDRRMLADDFDRLATLLQRVPVRRFRLREGFEHLDALCDVLLADSRALVSGAV